MVGTEEIDISVPGLIQKTGKGHKDFEVKLGKGITLKQDQLRRDFWMNDCVMWKLVRSMTLRVKDKQTLTTNRLGS